MTDHETTDKRALGWPIGIVVGLTSVVVANAIMISIALSHPSAPASADHWAESLSWDRELEQRAKSRELGWSLGALERDPEGRLLISVVDRRGEGLVGLTGAVALQRSDSTAHDQTLSLVELGEGRYRSRERAPNQGLYELELELHRSADASRPETFVHRQRLAFDELARSEGAP